MSRRRRRRAGNGPSGLLLIDKPGGLTSHDVVGRVRQLSGQGRVGHAGTLDPLATGLLVVLLGEATKLSPFATAADKAYEATARLGVRTDTLDADGEVLSAEPLDPDTDAAAVERALAGLRGEISQQVPRYSAVKVDGQRLHRLARSGQEVDSPTRQVTVHRLELLAWEPPDVRLAVTCSKGTYVRQLVADLGDALGPGAHVSALRRTGVGPLAVADAVPLDALEPDEDWSRHLVSPAAWARRALPCVECTVEQAARTRQGQRLRWADLMGEDAPPTGHFALLADDQLVAVAEAGDDPTDGYRLRRVFSPPPDGGT